MNLGALDIASSSGLAVLKGEEFSASSFRPPEKRPSGLERGKIDFAYEGRLGRAFREHLRPWLVDNEIGAVAIEQPLNSNLTIKKAVVDTTAAWAGSAIKYEEKGGTTMATIFRIYGLVQQALSLCAALNIDVHMIHQNEWRIAFLGVCKAPPGTTNGGDWLKQRAVRQCELLKIAVSNVDQADAIGLLWALRGKLNPRLAGLADDMFRVSA